MANQETRAEALLIGIIANSFIYYGGGYLYGTLTEKVQPHLTAQAAAIYALSNTLFKFIVDLVIGGTKDHPKTYHTVLMIGEGAIGILNILAWRRFNFIGKVGTVVCGGLLYARMIYHFRDLNNYL